MNCVRIFFAVTVLLMTTIGASAQPAWMKDHADKRVNEINAEITAVDPSAALSETQKLDLRNLILTNVAAIKKAKAEIANPEEQNVQVVALRKDLWKNIHAEIFTKEQKLARKLARQ